MDKLDEYHNILLLAANFTPAVTGRPMHIINFTKMKLGTLQLLFDTLDDDTRSLTTTARIVGASADQPTANVIVF